jgi:rhombotail lipoprotein
MSTKVGEVHNSIMKGEKMKISLIKSFLISLFLVIFISGCASDSTRHATSVVNFLYPNTKDPIVTPGIPVLNLPLRVGIAFVPGEGGGNFGKDFIRGSIQNHFVLSEDIKTSLMKEVAEHFKSYTFVKDIQLIPSADFAHGGSFANLDRIRSVYGVDVIALLSYDQAQFTDEGVASITYWTLIGAYVIPGEKNDTHTMLDAVIYDIKSRKMLFRAPGTSHTKSNATPVNIAEQLRADSGQGFDKAAKDMIINLDEQLARFREKVKENPAEFKVNNNQQ